MPTEPTAPATASSPHERALKRLHLDNEQLALLCLPSSFVDCRDPHDVFKVDDETRLYAVNATGRMKSFKKDSKVPFSDKWEEHSVRIDVEVIDQSGVTAEVTFFGSSSELEHVRSGTPFSFMARCVDSRRGILCFDTLPVPTRRIGQIWPRYAGLPSTLRAAAVEALVAHTLDTHGHAAYQATMEHIAFACGESHQDLDALCECFGLESLHHLLVTLHEPYNMEDGARALPAARHLTARAVLASATRRNTRISNPAAAIRIPQSRIEDIIKGLPEVLTGDQQKAVNEITSALAGSTPLNGLINGDVATGKTLTFLIPGVAAHLGGSRVAIMAPTTIIARQLAAKIASHFPTAKVEHVLPNKRIRDPSAILIGGTGLHTAAKKANWIPDILVIDEQQKFGAEMREKLVGATTHTLQASATPIPQTMAGILYGGMQVFRLIDTPTQRNMVSLLGDVESIRSGLAREIRKTVDKGKRVIIVYPKIEDKPDAAPLSAAAKNPSPLPATTAFKPAPLPVVEAEPAPKFTAAMRVLCFHLGFYVSGPESEHIMARCFQERGDAGVTAAARALKAENHKPTPRMIAKALNLASLTHVQVPIVEPPPPDNIAKAQTMNLMDAYDVMLQRFPGKVGVVHGQMPDDLRDATMDKFRSGEHQILMGTTIVETGLDVPDVDLIVVREPDRFGVTTLAQIRGRGVRNGGEGTFVMMTSKPLDDLPDETWDRLKLVRDTDNGFALAEADMVARDFGDFEGWQQSGSADLLFHNTGLRPSDIEQAAQAPECSDIPEYQPEQAHVIF